MNKQKNSISDAIKNGRHTEQAHQDSRPPPREAVKELSKILTKAKYESVLWVGFGSIETEDGKRTGQAGLIVFIDDTLNDELDRVRKLSSSSVSGYPVMMRRPRTTFDCYHEYLRKNGEPDPKRFDCLPDLFWLDQ